MGTGTADRDQRRRVVPGEPGARLATPPGRGGASAFAMAEMISGVALAVGTGTGCRGA